MALTRITKGVIKPNEDYSTRHINSTGIVTATGLDINGNGDISGNLSVGGVLTYEDVTSIDSVGIITAQSDIHVGAGVSVVGVGTFGGGIFIDDSISHIGDSHTKIRFPTGDQISFENGGSESMRIYGYGQVLIGDGVDRRSGNAELTISGSSNVVLADNNPLYNQQNPCFLHLSNANNSVDASETGIIFHNTFAASGNVALYSKKTGQYASDLIFRFRTGGTASTERVRITSSGQVKVGTGVTIETNGQAEIAGITTFYKDVHIKTSTGRLYVGANDRISLIADPSHSYLRINGGHFQIHNNNFGVRSYDGNGSITLIYAPTNDGSGSGGVQLYHNNGSGINPKRFQTTTQGIEVLGHSELDNVSIAGVTTATGNIHAQANIGIGVASPSNRLDIAGIGNQQIQIVRNDGGNGLLFKAGSSHGSIFTVGGHHYFRLITNNVDRLQINNTGVTTLTGNVFALKDLDVDGHTNLDNVSIAGVGTFASDIGIGRTIFHDGDTHTTMGFGNNNIRFHTSGEERFNINDSSNSFYNFTSVNYTNLSNNSPSFEVRNNTQSYHTIWESHNTNARSTIFQWNDYGNSSTAGNLIFRSLNSGYEEHARFTGAGNFNLLKDLDVDGHTNLDNVSIAGVTTMSNNVETHGLGSFKFNEDWSVQGRNVVVWPCDDANPWFSFVGTNLRFTDGGNFVKPSDNKNSNWGNIAGIVFEGSNQNTSSGNNPAIRFIGDLPGDSGLNISLGSGSSGKTAAIDNKTFAYFSGTGHFAPGSDSTYDLGFNGIRWRNLYADTLYGDGSNLTGISGVTINNNADNRIITGSGSANTLNGESGLTFDGTDLRMNTTSGRIYCTRTTGEAGILIGSGSAGGATLYLDGDSDGDWGGGDYAYIRHNSSGHLEIRSTNPNDNGEIVFYTGANTYYGAITADGRLSLNGNGNTNAIEINAGSNGGSIVIDRNGNITSLIRASDGNSNVGGPSGGGSRLHLAKNSINFKTYPYVSNVGDAVTYTTRCSINTSGHFVPGANNTYDLGTSSLRWRDLYTQDLKLSNEAVEGGNDVDGTWGDYTIQEGESDLFLINNRNGKKYKFNLTEVS